MENVTACLSHILVAQAFFAELNQAGDGRGGAACHLQTGLQVVLGDVHAKSAEENGLG